MKLINRKSIFGIFSLLIIFSSCEETPINQLPNCLIVQPSDLNSISIGDLVSFSAIASDTDGSIVDVSFTINGDEVASFDATPYEYEWNTTNEDEGAYTFKVVATDDQNGTSSHEIQVNLLNGSGEITDIEGNTYQYIRIGHQSWMAENLATSTYNDGTPIPHVMDDDHWKELNTPAFCWFDNDEIANKSIYGALYNWHAVETQKLCPLGWHVPEEAEFDELINFLGGTDAAAAKLKDDDPAYWQNSNNRTNSSGFNSRGEGYRHDIYSSFSGRGVKSMYWSISKFSPVASYYLYLPSDKAYIVNSDDSYGFCVRCLKD